MQAAFNQTLSRWEIPLAGEVDIANVPQLKQAFNDCLSQRPADLFFDAADLDFIDSTGLGALVSAANRAAAHSTNVTVRGLKPHIKRIFVLMKLDTILQLED